jgi:hypothetical protein
VYGNHDGAWVDETTPTQPTLKRGVLRVDAERTWRATGLPIHIFRLPGIYGPGRGPLPRARAGTARSIVKDGQMFSRIHVDDIVGTLLASISTPNPGRIYNVCDNEPAATHEVSLCRNVFAYLYTDRCIVSVNHSLSSFNSLLPTYMKTAHMSRSMRRSKTCWCGCVVLLSSLVDKLAFQCQH